MRRFVAEEWVTFITKVEAINKNAKSKGRPGTKCNDGFDMKVVTSRFYTQLFDIFKEAKSQEYLQGCPWDLLHADDLGNVSATIEALKAQCQCQKSNPEDKGLNDKTGKTKAPIINHDAPTEVDKAKKTAVRISTLAWQEHH